VRYRSYGGDIAEAAEHLIRSRAITWALNRELLERVSVSSDMIAESRLALAAADRRMAERI